MILTPWYDAPEPPINPCRYQDEYCEIDTCRWMFDEDQNWYMVVECTCSARQYAHRYTSRGEPILGGETWFVYSRS